MYTASLRVLAKDLAKTKRSAKASGIKFSFIQEIAGYAVISIHAEEKILRNFISDLFDAGTIKSENVECRHSEFYITFCISKQSSENVKAVTDACQCFFHEMDDRYVVFSEYQESLVDVCDMLSIELQEIVKFK